ncbi:MAG: DNA topoisomerase (ATP-hydrolyzing) subunit B [Candidatus Kapaibacteriales bacterium]
MSENNKPDAQQQKNYGADSIKVLEGLEAVRKRPAMYIGDVGKRGLHHLINEVVDNSIDEALAGYCDTIKVTLHEDGSCSVEDNGRGIPTGPHPVKKISTLEVVMCTLHAGGKFDKDTYKVSGGLHGVGVSCVNALASKTIVTVKREGKIFQQEYSEGKPTSQVKVVGKTNETGTRVQFYPDATIFTTTVFEATKTANRLRELAFLNPQVAIILKDETDEDKTEYEFKYEGGLKDFVAYLDEGNTVLTPPIYIAGADTGGSDTMTDVELCMEYNSSYSEEILSYVNNINTIEGGTHVTGFKSALTRTMNTYANNNLPNSKKKITLNGEDFKEGLTVVISVKVAEPQFEGQTKTKLGNSEVEGVVRSIVQEKLPQFLDDNPNIAKKIIEKAITAAEARIASKRARELVRKANQVDSGGLPGKLADCSLKTAEDTEIYLVEGDSAGGSAKQGRDRRFQAILPLKGKILNVQKAKLTKILENEEIKTIFAALGAGFEKDFDVEKLRYHKIILMADADIDGSHIRTLLLTLFFNYMRDLIINGYLYIAQPPLYKLKKGKQEYYAYNDKERDEIIDRIRKESKSKKDEGVDDASSIEEISKATGITLSRFKGLGEMNPDQLWDTTMNPETRTLLQVTVDDAASAAKLFQTLMGDKVEPRREFIEKNARYVKNLDV